MSRKIKYIAFVCCLLLLSCSQNDNIRSEVIESIVRFQLPTDYYEYSGIFTIRLAGKTVEKIIDSDSVYIVLHLPQKGVVFYPPGKTGMAEYADSSGISNLFGKDTIIYFPDYNLWANRDEKYYYSLSIGTTYWWCVDSSSEETIMKHTTIDICYGDGNIISQLKYIPE